MKKSLVVALVLLTSIVAPSAAQAQAQEPSEAEAIVHQGWMQALEARSQELNRMYGLGEPSMIDRIIAQEQRFDPERTQPKQRAVPEPSMVDRIIAQERGRALDFGLRERPVLVTAAADDGFDWGDAGVGGAAVLALALLATAGLAFRSGRRQRPA
jgi:hypothetical protein